MNEVVRKLNWYYYGVMVVTLIAVSVLYYLRVKGMIEPLDKMSQAGIIVQYVIIFDALTSIPLGLYLIKWRKPKTLEQYTKLATARILLVSNAMPLGIIAYFWMNAHMPMFWVAAVAAIGWFFTKPTLAKVDKEMNPDDPNMPTY